MLVTGSLIILCVCIGMDQFRYPYAMCAARVEMSSSSLDELAPPCYVSNMFLTYLVRIYCATKTALVIIVP